MEGGFNALLVPQDGDDYAGRRRGGAGGAGAGDTPPEGPPPSLRERLGREMLEVLVIMMANNIYIIIA